MYFRCRNLGQHGQPVLHKRALRIVVVRLFGDIKVTEAARIVAHTGCVIPVTPVTAHVIIHQQRLEPSRPHLPINAEILGQKARHILPPPVRHKTGGCQLLHTGIHQREARLTLLPDRKKLSILRPLNLKALHPLPPKQLVPHLGRYKAKIVPPQQLKNQPVGRIIADPLIFIATHFIGNVAR